MKHNYYYILLLGLLSANLKAMYAPQEESEKFILKNNVEQAIQEKKDLNMCDGEPFVITAARLSDNETLSLLLKKGAAANAKWQYHLSLFATPLHYTVIQLNIEGTKLLLDYKGNIENCDNLWHETPLMKAVSTWGVINDPRQNERRLEMVKLLLRYGARTDTKNHLGQLAYDLANASELNDIADLLKKFNYPREQEIKELGNRIANNKHEIEKSESNELFAKLDNQVRMLDRRIALSSYLPQMHEYQIAHDHKEIVRIRELQMSLINDSHLMFALLANLKLHQSA